jgi:threonine/homoserine efflux transporter RhtA
MTASETGTRPVSSPGRITSAVGTMPPASFFLASSVFHYLGPALAVLLFAHVTVLTEVRLGGHAPGFAFANCAGFMLYVIIGHRIANTAVDGTASRRSGRSRNGPP